MGRCSECLLRYDSCVIVAIGGPMYKLQPNTPEAHIKMGALLGLGLSSIDELSAADLVVPDGFRRDLGV